MDRSRSTPYIKSSSSDSNDDTNHRKVRKSVSSKLCRTSLECRRIEYKYKLPTFKWSINGVSIDADSQPLNLLTLSDINDIKNVHRYFVDSNIFNKDEIEIFKFNIKWYKDIHPDYVSDIKVIYKDIANNSRMPGFGRRFHLYIYTISYCALFVDISEERRPDIKKGVHFLDGSEYILDGSDEDFFNTLGLYKERAFEDVISEGFAYITAIIYLHWLANQPKASDVKS